MTMKNIRILAGGCMAVSAISGMYGQESLQKEITVEREIVPEVRAASRLNLYPLLDTLEPAPTGRAILQPPYRG